MQIKAQSGGIGTTALYFKAGIIRKQTVTYPTLMAHMELGHSNAGLLKIVGDLAIRFEANVIGIAACQSNQMFYGDAYIPSDVIDGIREELEKEIETAEAEFRDALEPRVDTVEWRSTLTSEPLAEYLACQVRRADLVITGVDRNVSMFDTSRHVNTGDLVMRAGRPVLIVPRTAETPDFARVVIGWKDTRESRRAVADALPLLKMAVHISVVEIAAEEDLAAARVHLDDVVHWLKRHGVMAESLALPSIGDDAGQLNEIARERGADLIVAGAYGHSRLREWALGGVTRDLLLRADRCALVSH
jgi:nucleotide-binding universal stress UspA family protein